MGEHGIMISAVSLKASTNSLIMVDCYAIWSAVDLKSRDKKK